MQRRFACARGGLGVAGRHGFRYVAGGTKVGSVAVHRPGTPETILHASARDLKLRPSACYAALGL
jgi:hypothetical protein